MKKFALFLLLLGFSGVIHAAGQKINSSVWVNTGRNIGGGIVVDKEAATNSYKVLSLRVQGESGHLAGKAGVARKYDENAGYFGINYFQNFTKAPWLMLYLDAELEVYQAWTYADINRPTDVTRYWLSDQTFAAALIFANSFYVELNSKGLFVSDLFYDVRLGKNHILRPYVGLDVYFTGTKGIALTSFSDANGSPSINSALTPIGVGNTLSEVRFGVRYTATFGGDKWAFETDLSYRSAGDNATRFKDNSSFLWDNELSFNYEGMQIWGGIRYQPRTIGNGGENVFHSVMLRAGINYAFNFSKM